MVGTENDGVAGRGEINKSLIILALLSSAS